MTKVLAIDQGVKEFNKRFLRRFGTAVEAMGSNPQVHVLCVLGRRGHVLAQALNAAGITIYPSSLFWNCRTRWTVLPEVVHQLSVRKRPWKWNLVLTDSVETILLAFVLASYLRLPLVVRVRGDAWAEVEQGGQRGMAMRLPGVRMLLWIYGAILRHAECVAPVSEYLGSRLMLRARVAPSRVKPVPVSVDLFRFARRTRGEARCCLGWGNGRYILSVTNFRFPAKAASLEALFPSMRRLLEMRSDVCWVVVGGGPYLPTFRERARVALGPVAERLELCGFVSDMPAYYAASNLVAYFSGLDALPRAVLEAQASGRVVIANQVGSVPDLIMDQVTGYLSGPGEDFLATVLDVLDNPAMETRIGVAAQAAVAQTYSSEHVGARWQEILTAVADRNTTQ